MILQLGRNTPVGFLQSAQLGATAPELSVELGFLSTVLGVLSAELLYLLDFLMGLPVGFLQLGAEPCITGPHLLKLLASIPLGFLEI